MMSSLNDAFTSTGAKFFAHQEAMSKLRDGSGQPIVATVMLTDVCNHSCAFCSVQHRAGDSLLFGAVMEFIDTLRRYGLRSVILSGGGNPILYKCKQSGKTINDVVDELHERGLEIGMITNGMPLRTYDSNWHHSRNTFTFRDSWRTVRPETLDKLTWLRISMSGLDHEEREVFVPDIDPHVTTLGFSYVGHDVYKEVEDKAHGKVSRQLDLISGDKNRSPNWTFESRIGQLTDEIAFYAKTYKPAYIRLLPNCLEVDKIRDRCTIMQKMADDINTSEYSPVFVQYKPPAAPPACYLGYVHPVLNCDGFVYPCDSVVLNEEAGHKFSNPWRMCHWSEIEQIYTQPVRSLIDAPSKRCPGCVFTQSNIILGSVVDGTADITPPTTIPLHINFI